MEVEIITPDKNIFKGEAKFVSVPGIDGSLGILDYHAPLITTLKTGNILLRKEDNSEENIEVNGGVLEVLKNKVMILAE